MDDSSQYGGSDRQSRREDWAWVLSTNATDACGESIKRFYMRKTGRFVTSPFLCKSIICKDCGPKVVLAYYQHFSKLWGTHGEIWIATVYPAGNPLLDRISQRRYRADGEYALFIPTYGRFHHRAFVFSDKDLSGRKEPSRGLWVDVPTALALLRLALSLPGLVARPRTISKGWRIERHMNHASDFTYLGQVRPETWYPALRLLGERIEQHYGIRIIDNQKPSIVPDDVWIATLRQSIDDIRGQTGSVDDDVVSDDP